MENLKSIAGTIIGSAIDAVKPDKLIRRHVKLRSNLLQIGAQHFRLDEFENIYLIGAGKASAYMAQEIEKVLGTRLSGGVVSVKYRHVAPCRKVRVFEAGHPVPDENGLAATGNILEIAEKAGEKDLVLCLISGGGSALLESLPPGIRLDEVQKVTELLLGSGADIEEINTVRKHLSRVKGGQLAQAIFPATCVSVIISDVIGDPLEAIASGPTAPDSTTFADAWRVMEKYGLPAKLPVAVRRYLAAGTAGEKPETLNPGDPVFRKVTNIILGNNLHALQAAKVQAEKLGFHTLILSSRIQGEAREVARVVAGVTQEILLNDLPLPKPACVLLGGETTVTLRGKGLGGRNQELALAALLAMKSVRQPFLISSCGTDGTDGPTDAAGGFAFPGMWETAEQKSLDPLSFLQKNDSYHFLQQTGGLINTGPTGTNVMDVILIIVPR